MVEAHATALKLNGDVVEQSRSKGVNCSETFLPRGFHMTDKDFRGRNISLACDCSPTSPFMYIPTRDLKTYVRTYVQTYILYTNVYIGKFPTC